MSAKEWFDSLQPEQLQQLASLDERTRKSDRRFRRRHVVDARVVRGVALWSDRSDRDDE